MMHSSVASWLCRAGGWNLQPGHTGVTPSPAERLARAERGFLNICALFTEDTLVRTETDEKEHTSKVSETLIDTPVWRLERPPKGPPGNAATGRASPNSDTDCTST